MLQLQCQNEPESVSDSQRCYIAERRRWIPDGKYRSPTSDYLQITEGVRNRELCQRLISKINSLICDAMAVDSV